MFPSLSRRVNSSRACRGVWVNGAEREADLRHALEQRSQRLADPGEGLVEVGGDVRQVLPLGVRGEAEGDPRLVDLFEGLLDRGLGRPLGLAALVELLAGDRAPVEELLGPGEVGLGAVEGRLLAPQGRDPGLELRDLVVDVLDRPLELPALAPGLGQDAPDLGPAASTSASALTTAAFLRSTWTWYGSLSSWTSRSPLLTRSLSSTRTRLTWPATRGAT